MSADLAFINAKIRTMNPNHPNAEAVAIAKNKIIKVGTNQEIRKLVGKNTKVISLKGKTVLPGLIDTHIHVADFGRCLMWLDLTSADSIKELQSQLKEKAKQTPAGKWVIGRGWNERRLKEKRLPNLLDLDAAAPDNPVILYHEAAMICAVNSKALKLADVTQQTPIPLGGVIDRNAQTGEFTGIFRDTATNLIWQAVPEPTEAELLEATALACQKIAGVGLTSVHWIILSESELSIIQRLHAEGRLLVRVNVIVPEAFLNKTVGFQSTDNFMLRLGGVLIAVDGYLDSKTAALNEPYSDDSNNRGKLFCNEKALEESVRKALAVGLQPVIQAMGDEAVDLALKVIEKTSGKIRFRIEQAALLNKQLVNRLKAQEVVVSVQPKVISTEFLVWSATQRLGIERAKWLHPLKTLLKEGVRVAGGSDCPMEPLDPFLGVQAAVLRESFPEQRLSVKEALQIYTLNAAYCSGEEKIKGCIEVGKVADLTVLSHDPWAVPVTDIHTIQAETVVVDGKVVFSHRISHSLWA